MRKIALVIGVEEYRDQMISRLKFARADAVALAEQLGSRCKFDDVRVLADPDGPKSPEVGNIIDNFRDLAGELRSEDLFLFFFSGHGIEVGKHGYLLTRNTRQAFPQHISLSLDLLEQNLSCLKAKRRVLLIDACRNSPQAAKGDEDNRMGNEFSKDIIAAASTALEPGAVTALLSACRTGQRAYEWPEKGHSVFTHYLLSGIDGAAWSGDRLEFKKLASYTVHEVRQWSSNTPGIATLQNPWYKEYGDPEAIILADMGNLSKPRPVQTIRLVKQRKIGRKERIEKTVEAGKPFTFVGRQTMDSFRCGFCKGRGKHAIVLRDKNGDEILVGETCLKYTGITVPNVEPVRDSVVGTKRKDSILAVAPFDAAKAKEYQKLTAEALGIPVEKTIDLGRGVKMEFALIPPGEFLMGSPEDEEGGYKDERPQHRVKLSKGFFMGTTPITQAQYYAVIGTNPSSFKGENLPVESVSWQDTVKFCQKLSAKEYKICHLPTEAQWEYACRAGTTTKFYFSDYDNDLGDYAWFDGNSEDKTRPVGRKKPNAFGLYDMHGNVWEWCSDRYDEGYYSKSRYVDPCGPKNGAYIVLRGGSWSDSPWNCRSEGRRRNSAFCTYYSFFGFRVVLDL